MSLQSTDIAVVSAGSDMYAYFQGNDTKIYEVKSLDGKEWTKSSTAVTDAANANGSAITAYYVHYDGMFDKKSTIHVFFLDGNGHIREMVKQLSKGGDWTSNELPDEISKAPIQTSRLSSGVCHDQSSGAHQWAFFTIINQETGHPEVAEIRNGSESGWKWVYRKILPQDPASALPGTSIATNLSNPTTHLFFQDHTGDINYYTGGYESWNNKKTLVTHDKVGISTPLAASDSDKQDYPHLFYVDNGPKYAIQDTVLGASPVKVADFVPGTRFGACKFKDHVYLLHKSLSHPTAISTMVFDGSSWTAGVKVVG
ncbi:hypothetical protein RB595_009531 [Gaeumannomyces hyphopodioides]